MVRNNIFADYFVCCHRKIVGNEKQQQNNWNRLEKQNTIFSIGLV